MVSRLLANLGVSVIILAGAASGFAEKEIKIIGVDLAQILAKYESYQIEDSRLVAKKKQYGPGIEKVYSNLEDSLEAFKTQEAKLKSSQLSASSEAEVKEILRKWAIEIQKLEKQFNMLRENHHRIVEEERSSLRIRFIKQITREISVLNRKMGSDFIFDLSDSEADSKLPVASFADARFDFTETIANILNESSLEQIPQLPKTEIETIITYDLSTLYDNFHRTQSASSDLQTRFDQAKAKLDQMIEAGEAQVSRYQSLIKQAEDRSLSREKRIETERQADQILEVIQRMQTEVQEFRKSTNEELTLLQEAKRNGILKEIRQAIEAFALEKGAALALDREEENNQELPEELLGNDELDATAELLALLNSNRN